MRDGFISVAAGTPKIRVADLHRSVVILQEQKNAWKMQQHV